jgi:hypothetical protein
MLLQIENKKCKLKIDGCGRSPRGVLPCPILTRAEGDLSQRRIQTESEHLPAGHDEKSDPFCRAEPSSRTGCNSLDGENAQTGPNRLL